MMAAAANVFLVTLSALLPLVVPVGQGPIFLEVTSGYSPKMRRELSKWVALDSLFLMVGSYLIGAHVLGFFGISLPVVQVAGGLVVAAMGWTMLMQKDQAREPARERIQSQEQFRWAFYPLTLPITVGPGSISVAITLGANAAHGYGAHLWLILPALIAMGLLAVSIFLCYGFADDLARIFGETATNVTIRLSSFLLLCIGVQIVWNGISALFSSVRFQVG